MKRAALLLPACFIVAFLCAPGAAWLMGVQGGGTALENRALTKRPVLKVATVLDASWGKQFSDWVWDMIPLRDRAMHMDALLDFDVLHDSPTPATVVLGEDGFLFTRERVVGMKAGAVDAKKLASALDHIEKAFADAGVQLVISVAPSKASLYPEALPPAYAQEYRRQVAPVVQSLRARATKDEALLDLWSVLESEKKAVGAAPTADPRLRTLFRKLDQHWNVETGRIQAREIVRRIEPSLWDESAAPVLVGDFVDVESEMSKIFVKTGATEPYQSVRISPKVSLDEKHVDLAPGQSIVVYTTTPTAVHTPSAKRVGVLRDSFLSRFNGKPAPAQDAGMETIASFFASTTFVHWDTLASKPPLAEKALGGLDAMVIEVTQGNLMNITTHEAKLVNLAKHWHGATPQSTPMIGPMIGPMLPPTSP